jgi:hypothetical protein
MARQRLEELRERVLGNSRGREVEVDPTGQIVLDPEGGQTTATRNEETDSPKPPRMSPHTWGI